MVAKRPLVDRVAAELGFSLSERAAGALMTWLDCLDEWNARIDLTAARSPEELVDLMLADALVMASHLPQNARVVDVGTGAGSPGLALALLRDDLAVTLVEPLGKRVSFLRTVLGTVGRLDGGIERVRAEALVGRSSFGVAVSRATLAPQAWLELATGLVDPGGQAWVLLANDAPPTDPRASKIAEHAYTWPLTGAGRRGLVYRIAG